MRTCLRQLQGVSVFLGLIGSLVSFKAEGQISGCVPRPAGLVSWWSGEGNAADRTGLNPGTLQGGTSFEAGKVGQAFSFHAGTDAVKIPASASLDVGSGAGLTIEAWVNLRDVSRRNPLVEWNRGGTTSVEWGAQLWVLQPGDFGAPDSCLFANLAEADGTPHYVLCTSGVQAGAWQHVALTYDKASGRAQLYLNGTAVADQLVGTIEPETSYDLYLGRRPAGDSAMSADGLLDEVSVYDRALSAEEIGTIYNAGASGKCFGNPLLAQLIAAVKAAAIPRNKQPLLASLLAADESFNLGNIKSGINQLRAFKNKLRSQVAPDAPLVAAMLSALVDQVILSVDPTAALLSNGAITSAIREVSARSHGRMRIKAEATPGVICQAQYTTDFLSWRACGKAAEVKDGLYIFDDTTAATHPTCTYRILVTAP